MTTKQIYFVIAASCLALLGLIAIQVRWMTYSQELLEEQFEHRVDMALCQAVETTTNEPCCGPTGTGSATPIKGCRAEDVTESMILSDSQLRRNLNSSLAFMTSGCPIRCRWPILQAPARITSRLLLPAGSSGRRRYPPPGAGFSNQRELYPAPDERHDR
ncbi:MAG: hypothetical protein IPK21_04110 [Haliscomenobacter sp.]|nr:hypothetical protein [Haliscomenobacter sp.]